MDSMIIKDLNNKFGIIIHLCIYFHKNKFESSRTDGYRLTLLLLPPSACWQYESVQRNNPNPNHNIFNFILWQFTFIFINILFMENPE